MRSRKGCPATGKEGGPSSRMFAGVGSRRTETHVEQMLDSQEQSVMKRENMAEERRPSNPAVV